MYQREARKFHVRDTFMVASVVLIMIGATVAFASIGISDEIKPVEKPYHYLTQSQSGVINDSESMIGDAIEGIEQQVLTYPEDASQHFTTVLLPGKGRADHPVWQMFRTDPKLVELARKTKFNVYHEDSTIFRERFATISPDLPAVLVQTPQGHVVYKKSGSNLPTSAGALYRDISQTMEVRGSAWSCRPCQPKPRPDIRPTPAPFNPLPYAPLYPFPDTDFDEPPANDDSFPAGLMWSLILAVVVVVGIVGVWKKISSGK